MTGKTTSTLERPGALRASDRGRSRLGDLSRPIPVDRRITHDRRFSLLLAVVALAIAGALATALFVLPVQTWFNQGAETERKHDQLTQLQMINADLRSEVERLRSEDGIREAARDQLGFIEQGETRQSILDLPAVPTDLPDGWPYNLIEGIVQLRRSTPAPATP
jgi:cell division protein FtsB